MVEMLFNKKINNYTFRSEIDGIKSLRKIPLKFKLEDSTSKYRKEIFKNEILGNN